VPDYRANLGDGVRGLRIGVPETFFSEQLDPEVDSAVKKAIGVLEELGAQVMPVALPHIDDAPAAVSSFMLPEATGFHQRWLNERAHEYSDSVRYRLEIGATYSAVQYVQAQRFREMIVRDWRDEVFSKIDLLATAATQIPAARIDGSDLSVTWSLIRLTNPINLLGLPAISLPCGFTNANLPIGLQLVGRWWDEATVLRAAHAYEQATDWHTRRPPL
jgi:aspartyl-tRNA(Asn)/glutamyl-tRNA(Gln) amidotransferase subunit A